MEQELFQIGTIGVLAIVLIREGVNLIKWILSKRNGNGITKTDNQQAVELAIINTKLKMIEENHLPHIEQRLEKIEIKLEKISEKLIRF